MLPPPDDLAPIERLLAVMRALRSPEGCPWDREQTLDTLKPHLVEESYEVLDAIDSGDRAKLREELGDLLLQVVFQSQLCSEEGAFTFHDVATVITDKLIRRHPHVFGDVVANDANAVLKNWEAIKRTERSQNEDIPRSVLEGVPRHLPALQKAHQVQSRVARVGFDWKDRDDVLAKIEEELDEIRHALEHESEERVCDEIGDLLFSAVNLARFMGGHAEALLNQTVARFALRFREVEDAVHAQGKTLDACDLEELEALWQAAKRKERSA
jgi:tetrapyrrole methylase family protein / MazG family protein